MATTIPTLPVYSGDTPAIGQTQPAFNKNTADKLAFDAQVYGVGGSGSALNATIGAMNTASSEVEANAALAESSATSAEQAAAALGYKGEWTPATIVEIGGIYGYQDSEWRSLTGVSGSAPSVTDTANWRYLSGEKLFNNLSQALNSTPPITFRIESYHPVAIVSVFDSYIGGGVFVWSEDTPKSMHDGGMVIDPSRPFPTTWDSGKEQQVYDWFFGAANVGSGCYVRADVDISIGKYGAKGNFDGSIGCDDTHSINASTRAYEKYNDVNFSNISAMKRTVFVDDTKYAYLVEGACYVRKGQHLLGRGLGPARIYIRSPIVRERAYDTFRLGVGLITNPYPLNHVVSAPAGGTTITLSGDIRNGGLYNWLTKYHFFKIENNWLSVNSVTFAGGNTVIETLQTLPSEITAGVTIQESELSDSGGLPPSISNICTEGGHTDSYVINGRFAAGMTISTLFMTTAPKGIDGSAGDVNWHTITIDNGGEGARLSGSRNSIVGCHFFWNNIGLNCTSLTKAYDWVMTGCTFAFNKFQDIAIQLGTEGSLKKFSISTTNFLENAQEVTKTAMIHMISGTAEVKLSDINMSNMKTWAILQAGGSLDLSANNVRFDGDKSNDGYIQSSTARAMKLGNGKFRVKSCEFDNLFGELIEFNSTDANSTLLVAGNSVANCVDSNALVKQSSTTFSKLILKDNVRLNGNNELISGVVSVNSDEDTFIEMVGNDTFIKYETIGANKVAKMKSIIGTSLQIKFKANPQVSGSAYYARSTIANVITGTVNDGGVVDKIAYQDSGLTLGGTNPTELTYTIGFDELGAQSRALNTNRLFDLILAVPSSYEDFIVTT